MIAGFCVICLFMAGVCLLMELVDARNSGIREVDRKYAFEREERSRKYKELKAKAIGKRR